MSDSASSYTGRFNPTSPRTDVTLDAEISPAIQHPRELMVEFICSRHIYSAKVTRSPEIIDLATGLPHGEYWLVTLRTEAGDFYSMCTSYLTNYFRAMVYKVQGSRAWVQFSEWDGEIIICAKFRRLDSEEKVQGECVTSVPVN